MPSNRIGYGYGTYSDADFGTEGVIQTGSASVVVTSGFVANGGLLKTSDGALSAISSASAASKRIRTSGALVSSTASTSSAGEEFVLKLISQYDYGDGAYGYQSYGQGPLQTTLAGEASTDSTAIRVRIASASISAAASGSAGQVTVVDGAATVEAGSVNTASAVFSIGASGVSSASATVTVIPERRVKSGALISSTSSFAAIAREKWEPIAVTPENWVKIA
jgi:hypothetical protein